MQERDSCRMSSQRGKVACWTRTRLLFRWRQAGLTLAVNLLWHIASSFPFSGQIHHLWQLLSLCCYVILTNRLGQHLAAAVMCRLFLGKMKEFKSRIVDEKRKAYISGLWSCFLFAARCRTVSEGRRLGTPWWLLVAALSRPGRQWVRTLSSSTQMRHLRACKLLFVIKFRPEIHLKQHLRYL